jgi:Rho GDP-dissociation inhibitor
LSWCIPKHINNFGAETAEPEVKVLNLTILSPGRPDLVLPIPFEADEKGYAFALKDGSPYSFRFSFIVSNNIVSGLKYTNTVWKTGVRGACGHHKCIM